MDAIFTRRSVRKYTNQPIPEESVTRLLQAAMCAPSAGNEQPWEFVVIRERATMEKIMGFHKYSAMLSEADCCIVVCGNLQRKQFPEDYWVQDCSAATQNLLLEAVQLGLGGVWLGVYPDMDRVRDFQQLLNLPDHVVTLCAVALGHPADAPAAKDTYLPERVHNERW